MGPPGRSHSRSNSTATRELRACLGSSCGCRGVGGSWGCVEVVGGQKGCWRDWLLRQEAWHSEPGSCLFPVSSQVFPTGLGLGRKDGVAPHGARKIWVPAQLWPLLAACPWASHFASLCPRLLAGNRNIYFPRRLCALRKVTHCGA